MLERGEAEEWDFSNDCRYKYNRIDVALSFYSRIFACSIL